MRILPEPALASLTALFLALLAGCMTESGYGEWERKARILDFVPLGDTAFAAYLETYSVREHRGTGDWDTRAGRSGFVVFDRRRRSFREPGTDIPLSAAHALPMYFLGCEGGRPAWLPEPGTPWSGNCTAAGFAASPGAAVAVILGQYGRHSVHDRAMDTLGVLPPLRSAMILRIDTGAETVEVLEYRDDYRKQWKRMGFNSGVLDSAVFQDVSFMVQEAGWGFRMVCGAADSPATAAPCWQPSAPGLEAAIRAECGFGNCAWEPGSGRLLRMNDFRAIWIDPVTGTKDEVDWVEPALAWGR